MVLSEWKGLVENMMRDDVLVSSEVKTSVILVVSRVSQKDTKRSEGRWRRGLDSTYTCIHADGRMSAGAEEDEVRSGGLECFCGDQVEEVGGCMERLHPEGGRGRYLE